MKLAVLATILGLVLPTAALADDDDFLNSDAMEAQRCIWSCQSANPSLGRAYQQCVSNYCDGKPQVRQSKPKRQSFSKQRAKRTKKVIRNHRGDVLIRRLY